MDDDATSRGRLWCEFLALYVVLPLGLAFVVAHRPFPFLLIAALVLGAAAVLVVLLRDTAFDRRRLWNPRGLAHSWRWMLAIFLLGAAAMTLGVVFLRPELLLSLPRRRPTIWAVVMVGYPLLSVYPQEVIFRTFLMHRYRRLFGEGCGMVAASAVTFAAAHIVMWNWLAIALTLPGGAIFARTYQRSRSTLAAAVEHSLYGCFLFTVGLGWYFFAGRWGR
jgi:uncharacterized protein